MTRINVIPPCELVDKHLLAEYRELPRVFGLIEKWQDRGCPDTGVTSYTMGKGHVKFFYNKAVWLAVRFDQLVSEMRRRGFRPQYTSQWDRVKAIGWTGQQTHIWAPSYRDRATNLARINERLGKIS